MSMKMINEILQDYADYRTADTVNYEGHPAWQRKGLERLREILFVGTVGNQFYVNSNENILYKVKDLEQLIMDKDIPIDEIKKLIVSARQEGLFRTMPILALVLLRKRSPKAFSEIFNQVIITGNDLEDFLDINQNLIGGFGRAAKKAIHGYLKNANQFYAIKYRKQLADAIALSRPKIDNFENGLLLKYIYMTKKKKVDKKTVISIFNKYPQITAAELFKLYISDGLIDKALAVAKQAKLPADLLIGLIGNLNDKKIWRVIMQNMGLMQFIKYINKLISVGLKEEVIAKLKDITPEDIIKAKIFPYRLFVAWLNATDPDVKEQLVELLSKFQDPQKYPVLNKKWQNHTYAICPDVSASMIWEGQPPAADIAGFFTAVLAKQLKVEEVLAWSDTVEPLDIRNKSFMEIYQDVHKNGGGTAMSSPILYMLENYKQLPDIVFIITDSETWNDDVSVKRAWLDYKRRNPKAKLVVIEVAGYGHSVIDEDFANRYDIYTVFGWTDSVFKWIELKVLS